MSDYILIKFDYPYEIKADHIECWMPIKFTEPVNKKDRKGFWDFRTPNSDGYFHIGTGDENYLHIQKRKEFVKDNKLTEPKFVFGTHYSHLCHHWWCINPEHLDLEPDWVNIMRKSCMFWDKGSSACICDKVTHPLFPKNWKPKKCLWCNQKYKNEYPKQVYIEDDSNDFVADVKKTIADSKCFNLFNSKKDFDKVWDNTISKWF